MATVEQRSGISRQEIVEMMGWNPSAEISLSDIVVRIERIVRFAVDRAVDKERDACALEAKLKEKNT